MMLSFIRILCKYILRASILTMLFLLFSILYKTLFPLTTADKLDIYIANYSSPEEEFLILVNKAHPLSGNYVPADLTELNIKGSIVTPGKNLFLRKEAAWALEKLLSSAQSDKIDLYCLSGYRSYSSQKQLYDEKVRKTGKAMADKYVAYPGQSEHQTGLALDIADRESVNQLLRPSFGKTKEGVWLRDYSWKFGFIIRYPRGKEKITEYSYEPWHIRYVGIKAAREITSKKICLEEYL